MEKSEIIEAIETKLELKDSTSKLRWYIKYKTDFYKRYKGDEKLPPELVARLEHAVNMVKYELHTKECILHKAMEELIHPLKVISGVYFLIEKSKIVYVGSAKNLLPRFGAHFYKEKTFDKIFYLEIEESEIRKIESFYIWLFKPDYNKNAGENDSIVRELLLKSKILV